jgi:protein SCO1/2
VVATPQGKISHYLFGVEYSPKDLRLALVDSAGGKIGNPIDHVLLYCYTYDPKTGSYSASILRLVRIAGLLTILALVGLIWTSSKWRRGGSDGPGRGSAFQR